MLERQPLPHKIDNPSLLKPAEVLTTVGNGERAANSQKYIASQNAPVNLKEKTGEQLLKIIEATHFNLERKIITRKVWEENIASLQKELSSREKRDDHAA